MATKPKASAPATQLGTTTHTTPTARHAPATTATTGPLPFGERESTRLIFILLGAVILGGAIISPWWTRGTNVDEEKAQEFDDDLAVPGTEGLYFNYAPFRTPGGGTISFDAGRAAAVAILGIALVGCGLFAFTATAARYLMATGRVEMNHNAPVRLAIVATICGIFAVLWGAFFLPLMGDNPGMLYGDERPETLGADSDGIVETTRYANVGFFLGIVGAVVYPAYLWADAARVRNAHLDTTAANWTAAKATY